LKYFRRKIWLKYLPFFVQTIASFYKNFAKNWQKSQKIVITTMLRPIAKNPFADHQIAEFQFAEKIICRIADLPIYYLPKSNLQA
jgi:hypothetical protein